MRKGMGHTAVSTIKVSPVTEFSLELQEISPHDFMKLNYPERESMDRKLN